jgi:hypothetical protein
VGPQAVVPLPTLSARLHFSSITFKSIPWLRCSHSATALVPARSNLYGLRFWRTIDGYKAMRMIRKGHIQRLRKE